MGDCPDYYSDNCPDDCLGDFSDDCPDGYSDDCFDECSDDRLTCSDSSIGCGLAEMESQTEPVFFLF